MLVIGVAPDQSNHFFPVSFYELEFESCRLRRRCRRRHCLLLTIFHFIAPLHMAVNCQAKTQMDAEMAAAVAAASKLQPPWTESSEKEGWRGMKRAPAYRFQRIVPCLHTNILRTCHRDALSAMSLPRLWHTYACKLYLCAGRAHTRT